MFAKICIFSDGTEGTGLEVGKYLRLLNIGEQFSLQYQINGNVIVKWTQTCLVIMYSLCLAGDKEQ